MKHLFLFFFLASILVLPAHARTPDDPYTKQWAYEDIGAYSAWESATGSSDVIVAIIDNGFDLGHPDLFENVWKNIDEIANNGIDDDNNGYIDDVWGWNFVVKDLNDNGLIDENEKNGNNNPRPDGSAYQSNGVIHHGTLVAGLIGAVGNNKKQGVGINWNVKLMNVKVLDNTGFGNFALLDQAIRYAVDNGADIINMSVVGHSNEALKGAINYAFRKGVVIVAASGNENLNLNRLQRYPICSDVGEERYKVIGVSAIGEEHHITNFSNIGSDCIDLTAPGENISSTLRFSPTNNLKEKYSGGWSGTSFAAPFVSGAAALIKSVQPRWGPLKIYDALISTAHHTPGQDEVSYANLFGAGLLQIDKAIEYALERPRSIVRKSLSIVSVNKKSGEVQEKFIGGEVDTGFSYKQLVGVDNITTYTTNMGEKRFVSTRQVNSTNSRVEIYSETLALVGSWVLPMSGSLNVEVGDVLGTQEPEIVVAPDYPSHTLFRVYSLSGTSLEEYIDKDIHTGVSISLTTNEGVEKKNILALYENKDELLLGTFDGSAKILQLISIDGPDSRGDIAAGDIDNDGFDEYILSEGVGKSPFLFYYKSDGTLLRKFWAYPGDYQAGVSVDTVDYDKDGRSDILVWSENGSQPVRIWNYRSKKIQQWQPFEQNSGIALEVMPTF